MPYTYLYGSNPKHISGNSIASHITTDTDLIISGSMIFGYDVNFKNHSVNLPDNATLTIYGNASEISLLNGNNITLNIYGTIS